MRFPPAEPTPSGTTPDEAAVPIAAPPGARPASPGNAGGAALRGRPGGRALFLLVLLVCAYFIPRGLQANADSHLALTYALVEHGTARIDRFAPYLIDKAAYCGNSPDPCRHYYTDKAPGLSLLAAAIYAPLRPLLPASMMPASPADDRFLLRYVLTLLAISLWCSAFAASFWRFACRFAPAGWTMLVTAAYALGSMALPFSSLLFSHALAASLLFWAFMLLYRRKTAPGQRPLLLAGTLAGFAAGCEYPTALIGVLLGLYAVLTAGRARKAVVAGSVFAAGAAAGFSPALVYNLAIYSAPLSQGYAHLTNGYYAAGMAHGILGVSLPAWNAVWGSTFSPYRGLFILSPWLLLAIPGFKRMAGHGLQAEAILCLAVVFLYFMFQCSYVFWDGGASVGPRHFLPALPFLTFPIVFAGENPLLRRVGGVLVAYSIGVLVLVVATNPLFGDPHYVKSVRNPLFDQTLRDLGNGTWQNNWGMVFGLHGAVSLLPLLLGCLHLLKDIRRALRARPA